MRLFYVNYSPFSSIVIIFFVKEWPARERAEYLEASLGMTLKWLERVYFGTGIHVTALFMSVYLPNAIATCNFKIIWDVVEYLEKVPTILNYIWTA